MNTTIASITARALLGRRRFLLLLPLPLLLVGLAALAHGLHPDPSNWGEPVVAGLGFAVVLPMIALVLGTGVLGAEIDDGTIVHVLATPVSRRDIVLAKLAVAAGIATAVGAAAMFVTGTIVESVRFGLGLAVACAVASIAYSALFLALSLLTRRPVLLGLLYVLIWEGLLGNAVTGTRVLSVQQYVVSLAARWADTDLFTGTVKIGVALAMSVAVIVAGAAVTINRLRSFSIAGETS
jgi:ABC-2 type transport system permease protein